MAATEKIGQPSATPTKIGVNLTIITTVKMKPEILANRAKILMSNLMSNLKSKILKRLTKSSMAEVKKEIL